MRVSDKGLGKMFRKLRVALSPPPINHFTMQIGARSLVNRICWVFLSLPSVACLLICSGLRKVHTTRTDNVAVRAVLEADGDPAYSRLLQTDIT